MFGSLSSITWKQWLNVPMTWCLLEDSIVKLPSDTKDFFLRSVKHLQSARAARCWSFNGWNLHLLTPVLTIWCSFDANLFPPTSGTILYIFTVYPKEMQRIWWVQISWTSRKSLQVSPLTKHVGEAQLYVFCRSRGVDDWPIDWWGFCIEGGVLVDLPDLAAWLAPGSCKMLGACRRYTFQKGLIGSGFILEQKPYLNIFAMRYTLLGFLMWH